MMAVWPWRSRSMTPIFNTSWENPKMYIWFRFGDSSWNLLQVTMQTNQISWNSESKWPKSPWGSRSMTFIFNTSWEYPRMPVLCKFVDYSPNPWQVIVRKKNVFPKILSENGQNDLEGQGQWPSFSIPAESIPGCMFCANLAILSHIREELSCGQAEVPKSLSQNGQNDLEGQGQWHQFSIPAQSIPGCMFGANLMIPAQIIDELSCGQGKVYGQTDRQTVSQPASQPDRQTDRQTDGQTDRRRQRQ